MHICNKPAIYLVIEISTITGFQLLRRAVWIICHCL